MAVSLIKNYANYKLNIRKQDQNNNQNLEIIYKNNMSLRNGTSVQTLLDTSNPLNVDEYDTDLEGELAEKQRETYTQISAYDQYSIGCKFE